MAVRKRPFEMCGGRQVEDKISKDNSQRTSHNVTDRSIFGEHREQTPCQNLENYRKTMNCLRDCLSNNSQRFIVALVAAAAELVVGVGRPELVFVPPRCYSAPLVACPTA